MLVTTGLDVANEAFANLFAVGSSLSTFGSLDYLQRHLQAKVSLDPP